MPANKYTCFIISPIGKIGTEIRQNADDLIDLLVKPTLEPLGFSVIRGDYSDAETISHEVIRQVQEADLCIADLSMDNVNVYYEFGRRDETGKPLILLKATNSGDLPTDISDRRYIEYDLDSRKGLKESRDQLLEAVNKITEQGFDTSGSGASLPELAEILKRVERKIDRISKGSENSKVVPTVDINDNSNPYDLLKLSKIQGNIPMAERAMDILHYKQDQFTWLNDTVTVAASVGSKKAGDILIENAIEFFDTTELVNDKTYYFTSLVNNLYYTNRESQNVGLIEKLFEMLKTVLCNNDPKLTAKLHAHLSRVYFGTAVSTHDLEWLEKAIATVREGLNLNDKDNDLHFQLALCLSQKKGDGDMEEALTHALYCTESEKKSNELSRGTLVLTCEIMHELNDSRLEEYLDLLETVDSTKANLFRFQWKG